MAIAGPSISAQAVMGLLFILFLRIAYRMRVGTGKACPPPHRVRH